MAATWLVSGSLRTKATWGSPFHRKHPAFTGTESPASDISSVGVGLYADSSSTCPGT